jgi:hypothetical protein
MLGIWISYFCHHRRPIYQEITRITTKIARVARNVVSGIDPFQGRIYVEGGCPAYDWPNEISRTEAPLLFQSRSKSLNFTSLFYQFLSLRQPLNLTLFPCGIRTRHSLAHHESFNPRRWFWDTVTPLGKTQLP